MDETCFVFMLSITLLSVGGRAPLGVGATHRAWSSSQDQGQFCPMAAAAAAGSYAGTRIRSPLHEEEDARFEAEEPVSGPRGREEG